MPTQILYDHVPTTQAPEVSNRQARVPVPPDRGLRARSTTLAMLALGAYLWVIHSQKLALSQPAIILGLAAILAQRHPLRFPMPLRWFGAYVGWAAVAAVASADPSQALEGALDYMKLWVIFLVAANVAQTPRQLRAFMIMWLGIFALYPVRGTLFNLASGISIGNRYAWNFIFRNPNDLATLTLPMLAMVIVLLPREKGWTRWASWSGAVVLPMIVVVTQSRAGILALVTMIVLFVVNARRGTPGRSPPRPRRLPSNRIAYITAAILGAAAIGIAAPSGVWDRLKSLRKATTVEELRQVDVEGSAAQRYEIWRVAWAISAEHPIFGIGPGMYPVVHENYAGRAEFNPTARGQRDTHSTYFNALAEGGIPGLLLLTAMLVSAFRSLTRAIKWLEPSSPEHAGALRALGIGLIGFLFASIFATMQHIPFLYLYIAVISTTAALGSPLGVNPAGLPAPPRGRR